MENITTINTRGEAQVTLRVTIRLETGVDKLTFPIPQNAKSISLNNESARTSRGDGVLLVDITDAVGGVAGTHTFKIDYNLAGTVTTQDGKQILTLPILCGFEFPVESMEFAINLPSDVQKTPTFVSGYLQYSVEQEMKVATQGGLISGVVNTILKDHETLTMTLEVAEDTFEISADYIRTGNPEVIPMILFAVLALVYWIFFMRALPALPTRQTLPPEGVSAGELGSRLTFAGADLTMMVFHWAQLGYILIHLDDHGRVLLYKRMEMGNERSAYEAKLFRSLFGNRRCVDGTGYQYARLCRKAAGQVPGQRSMMVKGSGNVKIFLFLNSCVMVFGGICMAMNLTATTVLQVILAIVLGTFGYFSGQKIQKGIQRLHLRDKSALWLALGLSAGWLILGLLAGQFVIALCAVLDVLIGGLAAAYSGRRNEVGRQTMGQILGLRQYLKTVPKAELGMLQKNDPEYFFNMAPFAMALGVDEPFARQFGKKKLPPCPYLVTGVHGTRTAEEWAGLMAEAAQILDERQKKMEFEKFAIVRVR